ncbi:MAG: hypothetical protein AAB390_02530 [Patescibacteria group bacterium]
MYPTRLNLLSVEKKKNLDKLIIAQFIKSILELFLVVICFCAVFILISQNIMEIFYRSLSNNSSLVNAYYSSTNDKIKYINNVLKDANDIQSEYVVWTALIAELTDTIPPEITLSSLTMNKAAGQFTFSGLAKTRESLIVWQKNISGLNCSGACRVMMEIPSSQLTQKNDIHFNLTATYSPL